MSNQTTPHSSHEGSQREQLATYFLSTPPLTEQTLSQRRQYLQKLRELGRLEQQELLQSAGAARPLVWGNPAPLIQSLLSAAQRLAARLGQPLLIFPARETTIGTDTLLHPRWLSVTLCSLLCRACSGACSGFGCSDYAGDGRGSCGTGFATLGSCVLWSNLAL